MAFPRSQQQVSVCEAGVSTACGWYTWCYSGGSFTSGLLPRSFQPVTQPSLQVFCASTDIIVIIVSSANEDGLALPVLSVFFYMYLKIIRKVSNGFYEFFGRWNVANVTSGQILLPISSSVHRGILSVLTVEFLFLFLTVLLRQYAIMNNRFACVVEETF